MINTDDFPMKDGDFPGAHGRSSLQTWHPVPAVQPSNLPRPWGAADWAYHGQMVIFHSWLVRFLEFSPAFDAVEWGEHGVIMR